MKLYNLYYKNSRLNKKPISREELQKLQNTKSVSRVDYENKTVEQIPFNLIRTVECIVLK